MAEIIRIEDLDFAYAGKPVLQQISFTVTAGEAMVILGPSGIGKSTILRLIAGLLAPSSGTVSVSSVADSGVNTRLVFQQPRLFPWMSVRKNLHFALRAAKVPQDEWD